MNYISARKKDIANGPGVRVSLWVSGCTHRCLNCFNPEGWDFNAGKPLTQVAIDNFIALGKSEDIAGFSILGGEPLQQSADILDFMRQLRAVPNKTIWMWTGYCFEDLNKDQLEIVKYVDVLVDGPFVDALKNPNLRYRGSTNQRLIDVPATLQQGSIVLHQLM